MTWRFRFMRMIAIFIFPYLSVARGVVGEASKVEVPERIPESSLEQKVMAAVYIAAHGADWAGIKTWSTLMSPLKKFTLDDVNREASSLLGRVLLAQLAALPPEVKLQILQDQAERLFSE